MACFYDIACQSLNKHGEELCGDKVKVLRLPDKTIIVLSDGLGSGVKANILATLTSEIIASMLKADTSLFDVIETILATLPVDSVRQVAYATFTFIVIQNEARKFKIINFDNPRAFFFSQGRASLLAESAALVLAKKIFSAEGVLSPGDFLGIASDGVLHAGLGTTINFGWGWDSIALHIEDYWRWQTPSALGIVRSVINKTSSLYQGHIGDDATFLGVFVRERKDLMVFTGPPLDPSTDALYTKRLLDFSGRKIVCGGTTANLVARYLEKEVETDISTIRRDVPPTGILVPLDLVTEGIITVSRTLDYIRQSQGELARLPSDNNAAVCLAREILQADSIFFLVGQKINEFYQNPLLPQNLSIRNNLIRDLSELLSGQGKEINVEYC